MNAHHNEDLKKLITKTLKERQDNYIIHELFSNFRYQ